eukprot:scaffold7500_cov86-Skeletonema_menzelii.AAC.2
MSTFTEAEIDAMRGDQLRTELRGMGEERATVNKMRVPELKILMKTRCGITVATAPPAQNPTSGGGSGLGNPAGNAPPAQNPPSGGGSGSGNPTGNPPSQAVNDLTQALMN